MILASSKKKYWVHIIDENTYVWTSRGPFYFKDASQYRENILMQDFTARVVISETVLDEDGNIVI